MLSRLGGGGNSQQGVHGGIDRAHGPIVINVKCCTVLKKLDSFVTSTSQHQIFDEKFDQEPESVRVKMADLAGH